MLRTFFPRTPATLLATLALVWAAPAALAQGAKPELPKKLTTPEQIQEALSKKITVDYNGQSLQEVLQHVSKKTGVPIALDTGSNGMMHAFPAGGFGMPPFPPGGVGAGGTVALKIQNAPLGTSLKQFLQTKNLTWVIVGGKLAVTSEPQTLVLQMKQPVDLDLKKVPMKEALGNLAKKTGSQIVFDPETVIDGGYEVTLKLDGVALETAVRLMAFKAGLKAVRVDNVWVVTSPKFAATLPTETPLPAVSAPHFQDVDEMGAGAGGFGPNGAPIFPPMGGGNPPGVPMPGGAIPMNPAGMPNGAPMPMRDGSAFRQ